MCSFINIGKYKFQKNEKWLEMDSNISFMLREDFLDMLWAHAPP